jgi:hypothetical protein
MSTAARRLSEFEPAVSALVAVLVGVAPDCALGGGAVAVGELVAPGQQSTGLGVAFGVVAGCVGGHAVEVGRRVVFQATGTLPPEQEVGTY